ncbi:MAG: two-component system, NarL family, nitrate/nitrite response regulator NarL [Actinomycetota bacterium]|nr:two-component system, NarL family, nitrate/nitrite response regulator NarL [Actinomycetota bacterium]
MERQQPGARRCRGQEGGIELDIVRLALVDDGGLFGRDVEAMIETASGGAVAFVGRTDDHRAVVDLVRRRRPEVVLLDLALGSAAMTALRDLHRSTPVTRVVAITGEADVNLVSTTFRAGAHGVLLRATTPEDLVAPLLAAASGHCVLPGALLPSLVGIAVARHPELLDTLTPEERQLWRMVADGVETTQIAETLFVSERTAKRMVALLLRRLGVANRIQAAALAGQSGLLDSTPVSP